MAVRCKLSDTDVARAAEMRECGKSYAAIGREFGVTKNAARLALNPAARAKRDAWRAANHEQVRARQATWYAAKPERRRSVTRFLTAARTRARLNGLVFSLTEADVHIPETCPVYGLTLDPSAPPRSPNLPSLDRVDNTLGYIPGNVRVISWAANRDKGTLSVSQLLALAEYIVRHQAGER